MLKFYPRKICLVRPSAIGDTVHALGLVNGLKKGYPEAHITWLIQPISYEMFKFQSSVDRFITYDRKGSVKEWLIFLKQLRRERFDLAVIPHASGKTSLIAAMLSARVKLGFDWDRSRDLHWFLTNLHIPPRPMRHVQDQFLEFLEYLGIAEYDPEWNIQFTETELEWQKSFFDTTPSPVVGFIIATAHPEKNWPAERYAAVINHVVQKFHKTPLLIGGPDPREQHIARAIIDKCRSAPLVALNSSIRKTMLQLAGCQLVISPDTGPLHIAVAMNTPVVGLYGYTNPRRCGPYKKFHDLLIDKYNEPGAENVSITRKTKADRMELITPEEVIEKIELGLATYNDDSRNISLIQNRIPATDL
jgi:heptosyltransferase I